MALPLLMKKLALNAKKERASVLDTRPKERKASLIEKNDEKIRYLKMATKDLRDQKRSSVLNTGSDRSI